MKINEIIEVLGGCIITKCYESEVFVDRIIASDLMSDVLTVGAENLLLITGLNNLQTIRTAEMADISVIIIVRGKTISDEMIALAEANDITIIECKHSMYEACGILYNARLG